MKIGIVGIIHEAGIEILQSHGFTVTNVTDPSPVQLKKELADFKKGGYLHPEDVVNNTRLVQALDDVIKYYGD